VAGILYPCEIAWDKLACLVNRTNATIFVATSDSPLVNKYNDKISPQSMFVVNQSMLHEKITKHIPWIHKKNNGRVFDKSCPNYCTAPYIMYRRFSLLHTLSSLTFDRVLIIRPDSSFSCRKVTEFVNSSIKKGLYYVPDYSRGPHAEYRGNKTCPQSINDQWLFGDIKTITKILQAFPKLSKWYPEWNRKSNKDDWWDTRVNNRVRKGHFLLNTEGIYGKMIQELNINCIISKQLFWNIKICRK
jgi:hypothetical protein